MTGRCPQCGQRPNGYHDNNDRIEEINTRVTQLAEELGRSPLAQNCHKCNRIVFEGEPGFIQRYLLVDIV